MREWGNNKWMGGLLMSLQDNPFKCNSKKSKIEYEAQVIVTNVCGHLSSPLTSHPWLSGSFH